ncbi:hypothetical protein F3C99_04990 [Vitellibacter sp. q18]|jgi:GTPase SAR1 family protein|nr:hypothetical protein [Aequorivita lutea]
MTTIEKYIVNTYISWFENLSHVGKTTLFNRLTKSLKREKENRDTDFFKAFGGFGSEKSAEEIVKNIKKSRNFASRELKL